MNPLNLATIDISGLNLIEASAGTGKTWTITALYILLLLEKELRPEQILVVTYTKAATAELRERIRARIVETLDLYSSGRTTPENALEQLLLTERPQHGERAVKLLTRALYSFDDAAIFTIHGFCQRALLDHSFESGTLSGCELISDQSAIIAQVCNDFWRSRIMSQPDHFIEHLAGNGYSPKMIAQPLEGHYQNPDLTIIPTVDIVPLEPLFAERDRWYAEACLLWNSERSVITAQLLQARLNQQSYKPSHIEAAANVIDRWVAEGNAGRPVNKLEFFSTQKIAAKMTKTSPFLPDHPFFTLCQLLHEITDSIARGFQDRIIACRQELKTWLECELPNRKQQLNRRAFDDLLLDLHLALKGSQGEMLAGKLRQRFQAALIDEFQDTDPLQWRIFERLGAAQDYPLFLIGDPKQAIYSFRGADIFAYMNACKHVRVENIHNLATNFRSASALVKGVTALFRACRDPFLNTDIAFYPVAAGRSGDDQLSLEGGSDTQPLKIWIYPRDDESKTETKPVATRRIVQAVADETSRLLQPGRVTITTSAQPKPLQPHDIAVLVKTHRQADLVQKALLARGIPSVQLGNTTIFETVEALDLLRILRAVAELHHESLIREALLTATMGLSANEVFDFMQNSGENPGWESWLLRFHTLREAVNTGGIVALLTRLLGSCGVRERLLTRSGGERSLTNILHCGELLHQAELKQGVSLSGLIAWLERKISSPDKDEAALLRLETDDNAVMISTIHASKGLQYPVVFVPFAWDVPAGKTDRALFHNDSGELVLDLAGSPESMRRAKTERDAENARLLYVALTRAEFRCYLFWGAINGATDSALYRLLHDRAEEKNSFKAGSDRELLESVKTVAHGDDHGICVTMMPPADPLPGYTPALPDSSPFHCRTVQRPISDDWRVASFSSMTAGAGHAFEPRDHDSALPATETATPPTPGGMTIFDFPRGAKAGICLHEIFETLDFSALHSDVIDSAVRTSLAGNDFGEQWLPAVSRMVSHVTSARIIPEVTGFSLSALKKGEWQTELEFYLPVGLLTPVTLQRLFEGTLDENMFQEFRKVLQQLSFRQSRGMLQGFIDLLFVHNGRYYILDWKSNHLGMNLSDYRYDQMHESMCRSYYILQYHIYTLALDRLLKIRLPDYSYEKHFGGAIYLYLRGISADDATNGIYHGRPHAGFIRRAAEELLG